LYVLSQLLKTEDYSSSENNYYEINLQKNTPSVITAAHYYFYFRDFSPTIFLGNCSTQSEKWKPVHGMHFLDSAGAAIEAKDAPGNSKPAHCAVTKNFKRNAPEGSSSPPIAPIHTHKATAALCIALHIWQLEIYRALCTAHLAPCMYRGRFKSCPMCTLGAARVCVIHIRNIAVIEACVAPLGP